MRSRAAVRLLVVSIALAWTALLMPGVAGAYNRGVAHTYAEYWSYVDPEGNKRAYRDIYYNYEDMHYGDCANFVSQCLIAGGIRFRSSTSPDDNVTPASAPELGTGYNTKSIQDKLAARDKTQYSRTITAPELLFPSLVFGWPNLPDEQRRHGGRPYTTSAEFHSSEFWDDVHKGDVCFQGDPTDPFHSMFVDTVYGADQQLSICGHTKWRCDVRLDQIPLDDEHPYDFYLTNWKDDLQVFVVCLPDAPLVVADVTRVLSNRNDIRWYWGDKRHPHGPTGKVKHGETRLDIQVTFDTDMYVGTDHPDFAPSFKLMIPTDPPTYLDFEGLTGADGNWQNGWWVGPKDDAAKLYENRTWSGKIVWGEGIPHVTRLSTVMVHAHAADGSPNDADNDLAKYQGGYMTLIEIGLDANPSLGGARR